MKHNYPLNQLPPPKWGSKVLHIHSTPRWANVVSVFGGLLLELTRSARVNSGTSSLRAQAKRIGAGFITAVKVVCKVIDTGLRALGLLAICIFGAPWFAYQYIRICRAEEQIRYERLRDAGYTEAEITAMMWEE